MNYPLIASSQSPCQSGVWASGATGEVPQMSLKALSQEMKEAPCMVLWESRDLSERASYSFPFVAGAIGTL